MYLLEKLEALWSEVDIPKLKRICNRDIRLSKELKSSLEKVNDLGKIFDLLSSSPFCSWLEITILKRMAKAAGIPEAKELIKIFEKCVHSRKCSEVETLHFKKLYINPDYLASVKAKLNENVGHLIVADLIKYCHKLESILDVPTGSSAPIGYSKGCLEINFVIPTYWCLHAYKFAKSNSFKFQSVRIQYLQIGTCPKIYTASLNEKENAKCLLEKISLMSNCKFIYVHDSLFMYVATYVCIWKLSV